MRQSGHTLRQLSLRSAESLLRRLAAAVDAMNRHDGIIDAAAGMPLRERRSGIARGTGQRRERRSIARARSL